MCAHLAIDPDGKEYTKVLIGSTTRLKQDYVYACCNEDSKWVEVQLSSNTFSPEVAQHLARLVREAAEVADTITPLGSKLKLEEEDMDKSNERYTDFALHLREIIREEIDAAVLRHVKPYSS